MAKQLVCTQCGFVGDSKTVIKGNGFIEILLWLFLLLPGIIYSIWRSSSRHQRCAKCNGDSLIPIDTPVAQKIIANHQPQNDTANMYNSLETSSDQPSKLRGLIFLLLGAVFFLPIIVTLLDMLF